MSEPVINPAQAVPRIQCPSLERFRSDFLDPQKPVIIEKIIDHWPAFTEHPWRYWWYFFILWGLSYKKMYICSLLFVYRLLFLSLSIDYLRSVAGCRTVPIEVGSKYTDEEWSQKLITVNEFIDGYILRTVRCFF